MFRLNLSTLLIVLITFVLSSCEKPDPEVVRAKNNLPHPDYVANAARGWPLFSSHCSKCHGSELQGSSTGPPLIHKTYRPAHHADLTIFWAIKRGVKQHHWKFGDMPAQAQLNPEQSADIVAYIRQSQRAKGIH